MDLMSYQLGGFAIKGLLTKTGLQPHLVDKVIMGNVILQYTNAQRSQGSSPDRRHSQYHSVPDSLASLHIR